MKKIINGLKQKENQYFIIGWVLVCIVVYLFSLFFANRPGAISSAFFALIAVIIFITINNEEKSKDFILVLSGSICIVYAVLSILLFLWNHSLVGSFSTCFDVFLTTFIARLQQERIKEGLKTAVITAKSIYHSLRNK